MKTDKDDRTSKDKLVACALGYEVLPVEEIEDLIGKMLADHRQKVLLEMAGWCEALHNGDIDRFGENVSFQLWPKMIARHFRQLAQGRKEKEEDSESFPDEVTVCDKCFTAACWQGVFMCEESRDAGIVRMPVSYLKKLGLEHSDYWKFKEGVEFHFGKEKG